MKQKEYTYIYVYMYMHNQVHIHIYYAHDLYISLKASGHNEMINSAMASLRFKSPTTRLFSSRLLVQTNNTPSIKTLHEFHSQRVSYMKAFLCHDLVMKYDISHCSIMRNGLQIGAFLVFIYSRRWHSFLLSRLCSLHKIQNGRGGCATMDLLPDA